MSWDRLGGDDEEQAAVQKRQARAMFRLRRRRRVPARAAAAGHFGEVIEPCGDACDSCTGDDPLARLPAAPRARREPKERSARPRVRRATSALSAEADLELFERLREWRSAAAREAELPAFVILSDATLTEIALARPRTEDALLQVSGIGPRKLEAFGDAILRLVRKS